MSQPRTAKRQPVSWAAPQRSFARGALVAALGCFLLQSSMLPAFGAFVAAWSPTHGHVSLRGDVPNHRHPWDPAEAPGESCAPDEEARAGATAAEAPRTLCTTDTTASTGTGLALPAGMAALVGGASLQTVQPDRTVRAWPGFPVPIVLPPPIA